MDKQVIIAISREYGSGGHEIAKIIADDMGLNLYDRSLLDEIAREKDIKIEYLEKYDEKPKNATNKKVKWYVSNKKYAKVTQKGVVRAKKKGIGHTVKVYAKAKDKSKKKAYCKVRIYK